MAIDPPASGPRLWCGQHGRYEHPAAACDGAFDPDDVDWLVREVDDGD